jgi:hypothetical protein
VLTCAPCGSRAVRAGCAHWPAPYRTCPRRRAACPEGHQPGAYRTHRVPWHPRPASRGHQRQDLPPRFVRRWRLRADLRAHPGAPPRTRPAPAPHPPRTRPAPAPPPSLAPAPPAPALHPLCTRSAPALHPLRTRSALAPCLLRTRSAPSPLPSRRRRAVGLRRSTVRTTSARPAPTRPPALALSRRAQSSTPTTLSTATPLGQSARVRSSAWAGRPSHSSGHPHDRSYPLGPDRSCNAARMPRRGCAGALVRAHRRRCHYL